ncbi:MAG: hypothetical protein C4338_01215 [Rhodanobacteraceae bacterium]
MFPRAKRTFYSGARHSPSAAFNPLLCESSFMRTISSRHSALLSASGSAPRNSAARAFGIARGLGAQHFSHQRP